mgnify:CR=1 FL=1
MISNIYGISGSFCKDGSLSLKKNVYVDAWLQKVLRVLLTVSQGLFFDNLFIFEGILFEYFVKLDIGWGVWVDILMN